MTEGLNERYCLHDHVRWPVSVDEALHEQGQPLNRGLESDWDGVVGDSEQVRR